MQPDPFKTKHIYTKAREDGSTPMSTWTHKQESVGFGVILEAKLGRGAEWILKESTGAVGVNIKITFDASKILSKN